MSVSPESNPQTLDNPAAAGGDLDPESPRDAGAFQEQERDPNMEPDGANNPIEGEPVVQPQPDEQRSTDSEVRIEVVPHDEQPDASQNDSLVEQTDNSAEPDIDDAPQDPNAVPDEQLGDEDDDDDAGQVSA